jgi:hypothetical protein
MVAISIVGDSATRRGSRRIGVSQPIPPVNAVVFFYPIIFFGEKYFYA